MREVANGTSIAHKFSDIQTNPIKTLPPIPNPYMNIKSNDKLTPFVVTIIVPAITCNTFPSKAIGLRP